MSKTTPYIISTWDDLGDAEPKISGIIHEKSPELAAKVFFLNSKAPSGSLLYVSTYKVKNMCYYLSSNGDARYIPPTSQPNL